MTRHFTLYIKNAFTNDKYFDFVGYFIILLCVCASIYMNFANRSLWVDEAMLAHSMSTRSIYELTRTPLDYKQSAPIIFLFINKVIINLFGNTEFNLRILSVISYISVIIMTFLISKNIYNFKHPALCAAFVAKLPIILQYSNEFKQYIFETAIITIAFYCYYLFKNNKITWKIFLVLQMIFIWCANPVIFFMSSILIFEFSNGIIKKDKQIIVQTLYFAIGVCISFIVYYFYWLKPIALNDYMQTFWKDNFLPLFPKNFSEIKTAQRLIELHIMLQFQFYYKQIEILFCITLLIFITKRDNYSFIILLSILLALFASSIHMFPIATRLWCFIFPIISIIVFCGIDKLAQIQTPFRFVAIALIFSLILNIGEIKRWFDKDNIYRRKEEVNINIAYLINNINRGDSVYILNHAIPAVQYKIGYHTNSIGNHENNIIFGDRNENLNNDVNNILNLDRIYILTTHRFDIFQKLLNLKENFYLELILNRYDSPLYYFTKSLCYIKQKSKYDIVGMNFSDNFCKATIKITNIGSAYIGGTGKDNIFLSSKKRADIYAKLPGPLAPDESTNIEVVFSWAQDEEFVDLQLKNEGKFWFDELGVTPLRIMRPAP